MTSKKYEPSCYYCGSRIGEISEQTNEMVNSIFDCERCNVNYCDQCSYEKIENAVKVQKCIRCNSTIEIIPD